MTRWIPIAIAVLVLAGCGFTSQGDAIRDFVKVEGAQAYDEGLSNSEFFICKAASVGSVLRRYGRSEETAAAWRAICRGNPEAVIVKPVK
ncbi:hypothetical protein LCGC14_1543440 [marine sediment metagenome]|uniref:Lipoprotein n=1 Tax=marine sediment metagenome TaxID=412755 RepID=A0A0F9JDC7_9ZZZZ